jgi:hypothetical protein
MRSIMSKAREFGVMKGFGLLLLLALAIACWEYSNVIDTTACNPLAHAFKRPAITQAPCRDSNVVPFPRQDNTRK